MPRIREAETMTIFSMDGAYVSGTVKYVTHDCGCGGSYHGNCGDLVAEIDRTFPVIEGRWVDLRMTDER